MTPILATWGAKGYPTNLTLKEYRGGRFLDIRKHYGETPTRKGIMLRADQLHALIDSLSDNLTEILDWFGAETVDVSKRIAELHDRLHQVRRAEATRLHDTAVRDSSGSMGGSLFQVDFEGSSAVVTLNNGHRLVSALNEAVEEGDAKRVRALLAGVLQCSFHAAALAAAGGEVADLEAAEQHSHFLATLAAQVVT